MAENENYIGVAMGLDVTDLKAGLNETSMRIREANAEFKSAASGMDDWQKSTDGLSAKVKQLDSVLAAQKQALDGLQAEYQHISAEQGESSDAARRLALRIQGQQAAVNATQKEFNNYTETLNQAKAGTIELNNVTLRNGQVVKDTTDRTTEAQHAVKNLSDNLNKESEAIKLTNSEFAIATSSMDNFEKSTEGIRAKINQLNNTLDSQNNQLSTLKHTYDLVAAEQGESSVEAMKLQTQINNQKLAIKNTESELSNYQETLEQAEAGVIDLTEVTLKNGKALDNQAVAADEASEGTSKLGGAAKAAIAGVAALGAAVVGAIGGFLSLAESTREFREDQARLNSAFEAASLSANSATETYKTLFGAIGESDTAVEASQQIALLANSSEEAAKWAELATGVVGKFGDALKPEAFYEAANETLKLGEATGAYTQMLEQSGYSVDTFNAGLAALNTEEEKQAYMLEISNQLLGEAGDAYNEVAGDIIKAREAEAAVSLATAELGAIAEPIMTTLKLLWVDLLKSITPFVGLIGEGLTGAFEGASGASETLAEGLGGILTAVLEKITNTIPTILNIILELVPELANALLESLPQLLDTIVELSIAVINMLGTLLPEIVAKIIEIVPQLIDSLVAAIPDLLDAAVQFLMAIVQALPILIDQLLTELPTVIQTILDGLLEAIPQLLEAAITLFNAIIDALPTIIQSLIENLPRIINTIITALLEAIPLLLNAAITLLMAIIDALPTIIKALVKETPKIVTTITTTLLDHLPDIIKAAIELFMGILEAIPEIIDELILQLPEIITTIVDALIEGIPDLIGVGGDLIAGLMEGMFDYDIWGSISKLGDDIVDGFKSFFGIHSPSKLMENAIGEYIGEGVGVGISDSIGKVKKNVCQFNSYIADNLGGIKNGLLNNDLNSSGATIVNAGMTVNYNGTLSRKELRKIEQDNDRRVITKLKLGGV